MTARIASARMRDLTLRCDRSVSLAVVMCDDHPAERVALKVLSASRNASDVTCGELAALS